MGKTAIVAIPSENDYVRKLSSEKVPHLTLLFLGENVQNLDRIEEYLKHVADTSMKPFHLSVDRRGVLGDKNADVLFFDGYCIPRLKEIQSYLLVDPDIRAAHDKTETFPEWIPHLTLGYPETPAKPDKRDYGKIYGVEFDRVALWTGNYEGPEFLLRETPSSMSMSERGADFISHFGVKGMKWGVSRSGKKPSGPASDDHKTAAAVKEKAKTGGTKALSNKELQDAVTRMNLEQQYGRLKAAEPTRFAKGQAVVKTILGLARTAQEIHAVVNGPIGKEIKSALKK